MSPRLLRNAYVNSLMYMCNSPLSTDYILLLLLAVAEKPIVIGCGVIKYKIVALKQNISVNISVITLI